MYIYIYINIYIYKRGMINTRKEVIHDHDWTNNAIFVGNQ